MAMANSKTKFFCLLKLLTFLFLVAGCIHSEPEEFENHPCYQMKQDGQSSPADCIAKEDREYQFQKIKDNETSNISHYKSGCSWTRVKISEGFYFTTSEQCKHSSIIRFQVVCEINDDIVTNLPIRDKTINWSILNKEEKVILKGSSGSGLSGYISIPVPGEIGKTVNIYLSDRLIQSFAVDRPINNLILRGSDCKRNVQK